MSDGRLLFAAWQRSTLERGTRGRVALFGVNIDGTDYALFAGEQTRRVRHTPCETTGGLVVFVEADEVPWDGAGMLACVRMRRPLHSYRQITQPSDGLFHSPSPLADGRILVSRRPAASRGTHGASRGTHGIVRLDPQTGKYEPIFDDSRYHDIQARVIDPRKEPDGRSSVVSEKDPHGKFYCLNVNLSDFENRDWMPPGTVKRLRVLEGIPIDVNQPQHAVGRISNPSSSVGRISNPSSSVGRISNPSPGRRIKNPSYSMAQRRLLGEIDVEPDGSFNIEIPADTPVELQILDARGMALRSCSWIWAKNHEPRGCIGCHEDGELTPENVFMDAVKGPSIPLYLPPQRRRCVDFRRDVMPIIEQKCVPCHGPNQAAPRLDGRVDRASGSNRAYESLLATESPDGGTGRRGKYVHPGQARTSPMIWHVFGRNTSRPWDGPATKQPAVPIPTKGKVRVTPLTPNEQRTLVEWIDFGAAWDGIPRESDNKREGETK